jgi:alkanesulfonate monooxygenase SsuD/methylene tetrahydromethanopterin reductase-like flavin-dependent oxidoreductase (luciferase family)
MTVTIGLTVSPQHGEMSDMRNCWMTAEELGVDALYTADHFTAMIVDQDQATRTDSAGDRGKPKLGGKNFEGSSIEAAMAATTSRARIGCICHPVGFRNFNLLADMARTVDHLSNGRSILGLGTGFLRADFEEYGYDFGTQISRAQDLARAVPIIKKRLGKLNPPPTRKLPFLIASMGEKIGMRVVAEHADIWNMPGGDLADAIGRSALLDRLCNEAGRDPAQITRSVVLPASYDEPAATRTAIREATGAGFSHVVLSLAPPYPAGVARWVSDEIIRQST